MFKFAELAHFLLNISCMDRDADGIKIIPLLAGIA